MVPQAPRPLTMKQGIFGHRIPRRFKPVSRLWVMMCGVIMWLLWLERNDATFNNTRWHSEKMQNLIWLGLVDYGRITWSKALAKCKSHPMKSKSNRDKFKIQWCSGGSLWGLGITLFSLISFLVLVCVLSGLAGPVFLLLSGSKGSLCLFQKKKKKRTYNFT